MNLREYVEQLPTCHLARKEYERLVEMYLAAVAFEDAVARYDVDSHDVHVLVPEDAFDVFTDVVFDALNTYQP